MADEAAPAGMPLRLGGALCLDFVNTVSPRAPAGGRDYLTGYTDLAAWAMHVGIVGRQAAALLQAEAARRPAAAAATFTWAITLREALYGLFAAVAAGRQPVAPDLDTLNAALAAVLPHARLTPTPSGFVWDWEEHDGVLESVLWPVARSALELLTSADAHRIKDCSHHGGCGWLFLDTSKNGSRRWCSMQVCGSHAKVRRRREIGVPGLR